MYLYENAIIEDINKLFTNSKVSAVIADSLSEGLRRVAAKNEDKITLPAVVLTGGEWNLDDSNFYSLMHGSGREENRKLTDIPESVAKRANIIAFTPSYDMFIMAQSSRECDMLTRELIFHYSMNPTLTVNLPYGINKIHTFNLLFGKTVRKSQNSTGLVYRTLNFTLQGAYLWHNNTFNLVKEVKVKEVRSEYDYGELQN